MSYNASSLIDLLFNFYNVTTMSELSEHMNISQQSISKWKQRNSVVAIKKKCIELGIYNEIFGDLNSGTAINQGDHGRASGRDYLETNSSQSKNSENLIPQSILIELNSLYERIKDKDENFIKNITYEIEDYINEIKRKTRE